MQAHPHPPIPTPSGPISCHVICSNLFYAILYLQLKPAPAKRRRLPDLDADGDDGDEGQPPQDEPEPEPEPVPPPRAPAPRVHPQPGVHPPPPDQFQIDSARRQDEVCTLLRTMLDRFDRQDHPRAAYIKYLRSVVMYFTPSCWIDFMTYVSPFTQRLYQESLRQRGMDPDVHVPPSRPAPVPPPLMMPPRPPHPEGGFMAQLHTPPPPMNHQQTRVTPPQQYSSPMHQPQTYPPPSTVYQPTAQYPTTTYQPPPPPQFPVQQPPSYHDLPGPSSFDPARFTSSFMNDSGSNLPWSSNNNPDATVVHTNPAGSLETPKKIPDGSLTMLRTAAERAALVTTPVPPVSKPTEADADADAQDEDHGKAGSAPPDDGSDDA